MPPSRNRSAFPRRPGLALPPTADGGVVPAWLRARADAYAWPCPRCACRRNLRGLLREVCSNCGHCHTPPIRSEEPPHADQPQ